MVWTSQRGCTVSGGWIGGGFWDAYVLFLIALKMIFPTSQSAKDESSSEPFIVPLATPLIAGPSVLATLLVMVSSHPEQMSRWFVAL